MSDQELPHLLDQLTATASELNVESNSINSVIGFVEQRIRNANVGLEVWLDQYPYEALVSDTVNEFDPKAGGEISIERIIQIGFAKLEEGWAIAVREKLSHTNGSETLSGASPLLKSSRDIRLAALERLPGLIRRLQGVAENALAAIRQAKKLIE
jgi:hypothetical protein